MHNEEMGIKEEDEMVRKRKKMIKMRVSSKKGLGSR